MQTERYHIILILSYHRRKIRQGNSKAGLGKGDWDAAWMGGPHCGVVWCGSSIRNTPYLLAYLLCVEGGRREGGEEGWSVWALWRGMAWQVVMRLTG
jgi:hypothetical protein